MGFHKHTFPIHMIEAAPNRIEIVTGWRADGTNIGFHLSSNGKKWIATDLFSGARICVGSTRKECFKWCEEHRQMIEERMTEPSYVQIVMNFRELLRKELENL